MELTTFEKIEIDKKNTRKYFKGQVIVDTNGIETTITNKTSNSIEVFQRRRHQKVSIVHNGFILKILKKDLKHCQQKKCL